METFNYKNTTWLKVNPVEHLRRSNLINQVIERGDFFAINLETSELSVISKLNAQPDELVLQIYNGHNNKGDLILKTVLDKTSAVNMLFDIKKFWTSNKNIHIISYRGRDVSFSGVFKDNHINLINTFDFFFEGGKHPFLSTSSKSEVG